MLHLAVLSTLLVAATALPTDIDGYYNRTSLGRQANFGFATLNGGTRGGQGGATFTVWDPWAFRDAINSNDPRIVNVRGRLDLTVLFTSSPGVRLRVGSFTTIIGGDRNAEIFGGGIVIQSQNVIVQNIRFNNALSYAPGETPDGNGGIVSMIPGAFSTVDAIDIDGALNIWVDHCEFSDDPWIAADIPNDMRRHDGLIDMKHGASWITISNNILRNHNLVALIGASDDNFAINQDRLKVTYVGNWFMHVVQRLPFVRFGEVHILNNLYTDVTDYAIGAGVSAQIYAERNMFINVRRAFVGNSNPPGHILHVDNRLVNSGQDSGIPNDVRWNPSQYYHYSPLPVDNVENSVRANAGIW